MASTVQGTVINHGSAPYKNDPDNNQSYYVLLKGDNGETRELWGMGIRDAIQAKGIEKDDNVAFYDQGLAEGSKKRNWDVERIEKLKDYPNSIENDTSKDKEADSDKQQGRDRYKDEQEEFEIDLPSSVKNSYVYKVANRFLAEQKINFYDRDSKDGSIAFEDRADSLHTSKEDDKTIKAMLDVAQSKNWTAIKVKGTEAFKREAWLEASIRGVEVKGFKPQDKDFAELKKRQEERTQNELTTGGKKEKEAEDKEVKGKEVDGEQEATKGQEHEFEQELLTAEDIAKDYNLPLGYAEAIVESKDYKGRESLEKTIEDAQKEFDVDREGAINHIGEVNYQQKLSSLNERVSWNTYLNGFPKEGEKEAEQGLDAQAGAEPSKSEGIKNEIQNAGKAVAVDAGLAVATGTDYTTLSAVGSVATSKVEELAKGQFESNDLDAEKEREALDIMEQEYLLEKQQEQEAKEELERFDKADAEYDDFMMQSEFNNLDDFRAFRESQFEEEVQRRALDITDDELAYRYENMFPNKEYGSELSLMVDYEVSEREAKDTLKEYVAKEELNQGLSIDEARQQIRPHTLSNIIDYEKRFINEVTKDESKEVQELALKDFEDRLSKIEVLKSADQVEKARDDALLTAENYLEATKQLDADEKEYQAWKAEAMKEQEYELGDDRYRAEYAFEKAVEKEGLVRSNEFDAGRDVDYSGGSEVEAEVEHFHDNLAVPTGVKGVSKAEATRQVEASFDRKVNTTQRNQVIEDKEAELSTKDWLAVQAWRRAVDYRFKDDPEKRQEKHEALDAKIPDILAGKFDLEPPTITQQPDIEVSTRDMGSQDRAR